MKNIATKKKWGTKLLVTALTILMFASFVMPVENAAALNINEVKVRVCEEIENFENIAPDIFKIDSEFIENTWPPVLLRILAKLNSFLYTHTAFTKEFIRKYRTWGTKFNIGSDQNAEHYLARSGLYGIYFNGNCLTTEQISNRSIFNLEINLLLYGYNAPFDPNFGIEYVIMHEMGHIVCMLLMNFLHKAYKGKYNLDELANIIKNDIVVIAWDKYGYEDNGEISIYGEKNAHEWFAEVFAHLQCSTESEYNNNSNDVHALGFAMRDYLEAFHLYNPTLWKSHNSDISAQFIN